MLLLILLNHRAKDKLRFAILALLIFFKTICGQWEKKKKKTPRGDLFSFWWQDLSMNTSVPWISVNIGQADQSRIEVPCGTWYHTVLYNLVVTTPGSTQGLSARQLKAVSYQNAYLTCFNMVFSELRWLIFMKLKKLIKSLIIQKILLFYRMRKTLLIEPR